MKKFLRHFFLPYHSNNFRPKALHFSSFLFYIVIFFVFQISFDLARNTRSRILGFATDIKVEKLLSLTNEKRKENNLLPLFLNTELAQAAYAKAQDMFSKDYWAHNSPDGITPWVFITRNAYQYLYAGENLARDFQTSEGVVSAWMASQAHRENVLHPKYEDVGFAVINGILNGKETTLVVQMFGKRQPSFIAQKPAEISSVSAATFNLPTSAPSVTTNFVPSRLLIEKGGIIKKPLIDIAAVNKNLSLFLTVFLMTILVIDGILVYKHRLVRISGHNLAHVAYLFGFLILIWLIQKGSIL